jgi:glycosyltransferase involved in cell wall biosynthesis
MESVSRQTTDPAAGSDLDGNGLRVLVVHGRYRSVQPSGENEVVDDEARMLREYGCHVDRVELRSDDIERWPAWKKASLPGRVVWSREGQAQLRRAIERARPDVVHIHNTFPLFSPAVFYTARKSGAGVVHTLHNFRPLCPAGTFLRDGKPCELCLGRFPVPAVRYACYRDSRAATVPVALMDGIHGWLRTWHRCIDRIIAVSSYALGKYVEAGWPAAKMRLKYNTIDDTGFPPRRLGDHFLSMSRLDQEKGVDVLLEGWRRGFPDGGPQLRVAGGGDSSAALMREYGRHPGIEFLGQVERASLSEPLATARAVVVPSRCYEGFPRVIAEAYAAGVPVVASDIGSLTELVADRTTGLLVRVDDPDDMARALHELESDDLCDRLGKGARAAYERLYSPEITMRELLRIYREAIAERVSSRAPADSPATPAG